MSRFLVPAGVGGLLVAALVVAVSGVGRIGLLDRSEASGAPTCVDSYDRWQGLMGHWEGTWVNHTFSSNGTLTMDVVINEDCTAEVTIDGIFGQSGPQHISAIYRDENGTVIEVKNDSIFGDTTISVATDGTISLDGTGLHQAIENAHATGSVGSGQLDLELALTFVGGAMATETIELTQEITDTPTPTPTPEVTPTPTPGPTTTPSSLVQGERGLQRECELSRLAEAVTFRGAIDRQSRTWVPANRGRRSIFLG